MDVKEALAWADLKADIRPEDRSMAEQCAVTLRDEVLRLRAAIEDIGEQGDVCTFGYTRQICNNCRCKKKPLPEGPG